MNPNGFESEKKAQEALRSARKSRLLHDAVDELDGPETTNPTEAIPEVAQDGQPAEQQVPGESSGEFSEQPVAGSAVLTPSNEGPTPLPVDITGAPKIPHLQKLNTWINERVRKLKEIKLPRANPKTLGLTVLAVLAAGLLVFAYNIIRTPIKKTGGNPLPTFTVTMNVNPSRARIQIDGKDVDSKSLKLPQGTYSVTASMSGYIQETRTLIVGSKDTQLNVALTPIPVSPGALSVQFDSNFDKPHVNVDGNEQSGNVQLPVDTANHTFVAAAPVGSIRFEFQMHSDAPTEITQPRAGNNTSLVIVSSFKDHALVYALPRPFPVKMGADVVGIATSNGLPVSLPPDNTAVQLAIGEGKDEKNVSIQNTDSPLLQVIARADTDHGAIRIDVNQEDAQIWFDHQLAKRKIRNGHFTQSGVNPGDHVVKAAKDGFCAVSSDPLTVHVKSGEVSQIKFDLEPNPSLTFEDVPGGGRISIDGKDVAGSALNNLQPTTHSISVSAPGFENFSGPLQLSCGKNSPYNVRPHLVAIKVPPPPLVKTTLEIRVTPANARVTVSGPGNKIYTDFPKPVEIEPGTYKVHASLDGYSDANEKVTLHAGETRALTLTLQRRIASWNPPLSASAKNTRWHRAASLSIYGDENASGIYEFQIHKHGILKATFGSWIVGYHGSGNYIEFRVQGKELQFRNVSSPHWAKVGDVDVPQNANTLFVRLHVSGTTVRHEVGIDKSSLVQIGSPAEFPAGAFGLAQGSEIAEFSH